MDAAQQRAHEQQVVAEMNTTGQFIPMTREGPPCNFEGIPHGAFCDLVQNHRGQHFFAKPRERHERAAGLATNGVLEEETFGGEFQHAAAAAGESFDPAPPEVHTEHTQEAAASPARRTDPAGGDTEPGGSANRVLVELGPSQLRCLLGLPDDPGFYTFRFVESRVEVTVPVEAIGDLLRLLARVGAAPVPVRVLGSPS